MVARSILTSADQREESEDQDFGVPATNREQAANASIVQWRAARLRMDYLLSTTAKVQEAARGLAPSDS